jgi:hypothetical protein
VDDLTVAKLHYAHRECWSPLVADDVFGDPEITLSEDSPDVETRRLAWDGNRDAIGTETGTRLVLTEVLRWDGNRDAIGIDGSLTLW